MDKRTQLLNDPDVMLLRTAKPQPVDFVSMVQHFTQPDEMPTMPRDFNLGNFWGDWRLIPFGKDTYGLYKASGYKSYNVDTGSLNDDFVDESRAGMGAPTYVVKFNRHEYEDAKMRWEQYWEWKKNRNEKRSVLEEQFGYDCYTDDTEFLTNTGWKTFDQVLDTDNLATFNQYSHNIVYQSPTERIDSLYTGNLYHLRGQHVDTLVTANHNMFVRPYSRTTQTEGNWGFERAAELSETFDTLNVISPKINRQLLPPGFNIQVLDHVAMLDYMRLIGWYISDGTMQFYDAYKGQVKSMMISQSKPQSKLTQTLSKQINSGKIKSVSYEYEPGKLANFPERRWFFDRQLSQHLFDDCGHGSAHKRLPSWCFFLTKREMTTLLVALLQGDGTKKNHQNHTYVYYTINSDLANDVQRLAFLCGVETSLYGPYLMDGELSVGNSMYHVHINMRPRLTRRHVRSASVTKEAVVERRIVCFMVPNFTLVTRRNGHIGLHGNTKHAMHLVRLLRMGAEVLTEGKLHVRRPDAAELLEIRNGKWTYEQVVAYAEMMDKKVREELYPKTSLPKKPNIHLAAELVLQVQDLTWGE